MSASSKGGLYAVCGSFIALSVTTVSLRFYARKYQKVSLGLDDWTALFGVVTYIAAAAIALCEAVRNEDGYGNPTPAETAATAKTLAWMAFTYDFLNVNTLACSKLSALFMYRRIFSVGRHNWFNRIIWATVVVIAVWYITSDFLSLYQCPGHFSAAWDGDWDKYCYLNPVWALELAISDLILDLWVLALPIIPIMRLHATLARKLSILGIFLLAFVGLGASIVRIIFFWGTNEGSAKVVYIAMLEEGISVTVVNLPSIYYLCTSVIPSRIAGSLHSLRSMVSNSSIISRSRSRSVVTANHTGPLDDENEFKAPITTLEEQGKSDRGSLKGLSTASTNGHDVEAGHG